MFKGDWWKEVKDFIKNGNPYVVGEDLMAEMRKFETGATRNIDTDKPDYEGFLSPLVIEQYGKYMNSHRKQADGDIRDSDNWQKGIPKEAYVKSAWRHFFDWWKWHRKIVASSNVPINYDILEEALCALMFNTMGYLHEHLKAKEELLKPGDSYQYVPYDKPLTEINIKPGKISQDTPFEDYGILRCVSCNEPKKFRGHDYPNDYHSAGRF